VNGAGDRRGLRLALELVFLGGLAAALAVAEARGLVIVGVMAAGWLLAAGIEWASWQDRPRFDGGLPPRWNASKHELPPPRPVEQRVERYPDARRDEAMTWIAPPESRRQQSGEWPGTRGEDA
jgi:hypothetical protein